jgi:zinc/manganese transport system substrate-binding protein
MSMFRTVLTALLLAIGLGSTGAAKIKVVTSSTDLAAITREVGGDLVEVTSIGSGKANLHFVELLPSYMLQVAKANLYFKIGLSMDMWANGIIDGSRNGKLVVIDCSKGIDVLDKPTGRVDASMGDVHPEGNPHYWLDPRNGKIIANNILDGLAQVDPANLATYQTNHDSFVARLDQKWQDWSARAVSIKGTPIVSYHSSFVYFAAAFGLETVGYIEPKPGIEPTASHTAELIDIIKRRGVKVILREPYFSSRAPDAIAKATGAVVCTAPTSVGGAVEATDYFGLFDTLLDQLARNAAVRP